MKLSLQQLGAVAQLVYRRLRRIAIGIVVLFAIAYVWDLTLAQNQRALTEHTQKMSRLVLQQAEHEASIWLAEDNLVGLQTLVDHLNEQPEIISASIHDPFGQQLASSNPQFNDISATEDSSELRLPITMVGEIEQGDRTVGYIQIMFDRDISLTYPQRITMMLTERGGILLLLSVLAGILLMAGFNRIRWRRRGAIETPADSSD